MRTSIMLAFLLCQSAAIWGATEEKEVPSAIREVVVFRQGAQVFREGKAALPEGRSVLVFSGLSPVLDLESIQVGAAGNFTILSVNSRRNYLQAKEADANVKNLQAQLEAARDRYAREQAISQVLTEEENLLLANKMIGGQQTGVSIQELKAAATLYRERLTEIKLLQIDIRKKLNAIQLEIDKWQNQLNTLNAQLQPIAVSEILVAVEAPAATNATFRISYLVSNASWQPMYDLRIKDISSPVVIAYKASIQQATGEAWKDVKLTLSTGNPSQSGFRPLLSPWWLSVAPPPIVYRDGMRAMTESAKEADDALAYDKAPAAGGPAVTQRETTTNIEFRIETPYDVPSGGQPYTVLIAEHKAPASYEYYVTPKLDPDAFLTARMTDWEKYNLLSGEATLFFEDTYVGKTMIDVENTNDTLNLSLGRDKNIVVKRTKQLKYSDKQFLGNKVTHTIGWDIELRNKKKQAVRIVVEDQFPVSTTEEIEVKLEKSSKAKVNESEGKLTWELNLAAGANEKLEFRYSVKHPKNLAVYLE